MNVACFGGPEEFRRLLPASVCRMERPEELEERAWDLLAVTEDGGERLAGKPCRCRCGTLLLPGYQGELAMSRVETRRVISYGLSSRDSLTLSSLEPGAVLCVQRALLRPDGSRIEPQEIPLPPLSLPPEAQLLAFGIRLLMGLPLSLSADDLRR